MCLALFHWLTGEQLRQPLQSRRPTRPVVIRLAIGEKPVRQLQTCVAPKDAELEGDARFRCACQGPVPPADREDNWNYDYRDCYAYQGRQLRL